MKTQTIIALLALTLTACTPEFIPAPAEMLVPPATTTLIPQAPTPILEAAPSIVLPTPLPTNPPTIMITPDPIQVERWQEYQTELAKLILLEASVVSPNYYEHSLCEWVILGRSGQEVYVYATCAGLGTEGKRPAVIYLEADGAIRNVKLAGYKGPYFDLDLFPIDIQEKISSYSILKELYDHLIYRETHADVPPLIILSAMPTATLTP